jgi:hypothetical protein
VAVCEVEISWIYLSDDNDNHAALPALAPWPQLQAQFVTAQIGSANFHHFHQAWPFLHVPTFTLEEHTLLTSALANLSMWMRNGANGDHLVPDTINQELIQAFMPQIVSTSVVSIVSE